MRTSTFSTALVAILASVVTASPIAGSDIVYPRAATEGVEARSTDIGLFFCKAWGFGAPCLYNRYQYAVCYNVPGDYNDQISAIGPDQNQGSCDLYANANCQSGNPGGHLPVGYPGYASITGDVSSWNDVISSFICWP
ncbi:hypothetical protein Q9L58_002238 [Maublancomyces gigas]|uniref:Uncharacterized protein n=1 Tax=Discina gigas TaxID=1032678 RepID=A0ABR3GSB6_9PEZI